MKKVYLSALALSGAVVAFGQVVTPTASQKYELQTERVTSEDRPEALSSDRAVIWSDGFDTPADWLYNGPVGATPPNNGWSIGTTVNGWYFGTTGGMGTTGNFARFSNSDGTGATSGVVENGPMTFEYDMTFDLSGVCSPIFEYQQYGARFITLQAVEVSTDGGTTWIEIGNNNDITPLTAGGGAVYPMPQTRRYSMATAIAANPSNVRVRFSWDGAMNGPSMNYIDYGWFVDNASIVDGENYDHDLQSAYFRSGVGISYPEGMEYYKVPTSQLTAIQMSSETVNLGCLDHTGTVAAFDVEFGGSNVFAGTSPTVTVPANTGDSLAATTTFTPASGVGTYSIIYSISGANADGITTNDEITDEFEVTDYIYSRSNGNMTGSITNVTSNTDQPMSIGNEMDIFADGVIGAIDIMIGDDATAADGGIVYAAVYKFDGTDFIYENQTDDYDVLSSDINSMKRLTFDPAIEVFAGEYILVVAGHYGAPEVPFGYAQSTIQGSVLGTVSDGSIFSLTNPEAIMIDVHMRSYVGVDEISNNFSIGQNVPNPFNATSVISYSLETTNDVSIEIVDITGKVVKVIDQGSQTAGSYQITLDANDFAEGTYFYTFTVGDKQVTNRMVITK